MLPRIPLPPALATEPFRVAEALDAGVGAKRLRNAELARPFRGLRVPQRAIGRSDAELYARLLRPGDRFSHTTAALLWGAPLPKSADGGLHVTAGPEANRPRRAGVIGHRDTRGRAAMRRGLPCSDAITTFLELATALQVDDLVAVGDHLVLDPRVLDPEGPRPFVTLTDLHEAVAKTSGRGVLRARSAVDLIREGVESRPETLLRLACLRAGLPEPRCGAAVFDGHGRRIGWFDLVWSEFRAIAEYDGDQHRTSTKQYELDITRFDRASDAGHRVVRVRSHGLFQTPAVTVERIRDALMRGGWSPNGQ